MSGHPRVVAAARGHGREVIPTDQRAEFNVWLGS
jgi:hypothetical protein